MWNGFSTRQTTRAPSIPTHTYVNIYIKVPMKFRFHPFRTTQRHSTIELLSVAATACKSVLWNGSREINSVSFAMKSFENLGIRKRTYSHTHTPVDMYCKGNTFCYEKGYTLFQHYKIPVCHIYCHKLRQRQTYTYIQYIHKWVCWLTLAFTFFTLHMSWN